MIRYSDDNADFSERKLLQMKNVFINMMPEFFIQNHEFSIIAGSRGNLERFLVNSLQNVVPLQKVKPSVLAALFIHKVL